jgi:hypothetical protein
MAELTEPQKAFIVTLLAQFNSPAEVRDLFHEEFGGDKLTVQQIGAYDPTRPRFDAGDRWIPLFEEVRKAYVTDVSAIPIAQQSFRLNQLNKMASQALRAGNRAQAAALYKQAAEEVGGAFTNERNVKVEQTKGGFRDLTPEERRQMIAEQLREVMGKDVAQTAPTSSATQ